MKKSIIIFSVLLTINACSSNTNESSSTPQEEPVENTTTENMQEEQTTENAELEKDIEESIEAVDNLLNDL